MRPKNNNDNRNDERSLCVYTLLYKHLAELTQHSSLLPLECVSSFHESLSQLYACRCVCPVKKIPCVYAAYLSTMAHKIENYTLSAFVEDKRNYRLTYFSLFFNAQRECTPLRDVKSSLIHAVAFKS